MIYLSDDYLTKYSDTLSYFLGRSYDEGYSFDYIEKSVAYSLPICELEKSNVTLLAFSSMERLYVNIFPSCHNDYNFDPYDTFGWIGNTYLHLFLSLEITFEALFMIIPIKEMLNLYHLYHEMNFTQILECTKERMSYSLLDVVMRKRKLSNKDLASLTSLSASTINALRYGNRDIAKLEADKLLLLCRALNVKMETLLPNIRLTCN